MKSKYFTALSAVLALTSGCGGGGEGNSGQTTPVTVPSPGTTPSPTPAPTPTPSPTYSTFEDFSQNWAMATPYAEIVLVRNSVTSFTMDVEARSTLNTRFDAADISYTGTPVKSAQVNDYVNSRYATFVESDLIYDQANAVVFNNRQNFVSYSFGIGKNTYFNNNYIIPSNFSFQYEEVQTGGAQIRYSTTRFFLTGYRTLPTDVPMSGQKTFRCYLDSSTVSYDGASGLRGTANLIVDFNGNRLDGTFSTSQASWISGKSQVNANLTFSGTIDPISHSLSGQITSSDSGFSGQFYGNFFGPQSAEIQLIFVMVRQNMGVAGQIQCD
jgi:hypothetical protein